MLVSNSTSFVRGRALTLKVRGARQSYISFWVYGRYPEYKNTVFGKVGGHAPGPPFARALFAFKAVVAVF